MWVLACLISSLFRAPACGGPSVQMSDARAEDPLTDRQVCVPGLSSASQTARRTPYRT